MSESQKPVLAKTQAIKGTRDLLASETELWQFVERTAQETFRTFGYGEIRLPMFERMSLFERAVGEETDIVSKEMFNWVDDPEISNALRNLRTVMQHSNSIPSVDGSPARQKLEVLARSGAFNNLAERVRISLRPEATASVCRAYIEHEMQNLPQPAKLYYIGPMFRRERPQRGRFRQFYQIGAEVLETVRPDPARDVAAELAKDARVDAEVIEMLMTYFDKVGLQGATLYINSIGHNADNCRRGYVAKLKAALEKLKDKLGPDSQRRIDTNPLRVLDSKVESEQAIIATLPRIADHLCDECKTHYAAVRRQLELRGVLYQENWRLVRGLDYYMRTTFEITAPGLGSQNAVCGGGRYDGLVELLGGPPTKGIGFAIGEDRLILSLQEKAKSEGPNSSLATRHSPLLYIAWMGERAYAAAIRAAKDLRRAGFSVELPPVEQKFGKALGQADKLGAKYALILGDNEVSEGLWTLKTLSTGEQAKFPEPDLLDFVCNQRQASA